MANDNLITNKQLKEAMQNYSQDELVELLIEIAKKCPQAREFLTLKYISYGNIDEILEKYKQKIRHEFFPKRGFGRLNLREAKKAISDFKKISQDKIMVIDLMLFYVENGNEFTAQFGDITESFYNSAYSVYNQVIKEINAGDIELYNIFADRLESTAENACDGYGFKDDMTALYDEIVWLNENEKGG